MIPERPRGTRKALLEALIEETRSLSDLEARTGVTKPTLSKHLHDLEERGLVEKTMKTTARGREARYALRTYTAFSHIDPRKGALLAFESHDDWDLRFPLVEQVPQAEFRRDLRAYLDHLVGAWEGRADGPLVVLYGSVARGEGTWKSDIDWIVVLDPRGGQVETRGREPSATERRVRDALADAASEAEHALKAEFVSRTKFVERQDGIFGEAKREGLIVFGDLWGAWDLWKLVTRYRRITI